jgi:uncharacterized membrane protein
VSDAEVERLFRAIEALRLDMQEYRHDVHQLEIRFAEIDARSDQRDMTKAQVYKIIGLSAGVVSTLTAIITQLLNRM